MCCYSRLTLAKPHFSHHIHSFLSEKYFISIQMADPLTAFPFFFNPPVGRFPIHFNFAFHNMINFYHFYFLQAQGIATCHDIFSFAIPILLNFIGLKYQNQGKSPFQTHPKTVLLGILSLLLYCCSYDYQQRICLPRRSLVLNQILNRCILFFGYTAMAMLASLLFPDSASPAFSVLYVMLSAGDMLVLVYQRIRRQLRGTRFEVRQNSPFLRSLWRILAAQTNSNQGHLLPI